MPKKIKKVKNTKLKYRNKEKLLNAKNVHFVFLAIFLVTIAICAGAGVYKFSKDEYHVHKDEAIKNFVYSEKVEEGYNVYEVKELENKDIYATYNTPTTNLDKKWSRNKYLDFNEEIYSLNILDNKALDKENDENSIWTLELELADGTRKYYSSNSQNIDKTGLANIILKYFQKEIVYK